MKKRFNLNFKKSDLHANEENVCEDIGSGYGPIREISSKDRPSPYGRGKRSSLGSPMLIPSPCSSKSQFDSAINEPYHDNTIDYIIEPPTESLISSTYNCK